MCQGIPHDRVHFLLPIPFSIIDLPNDSVEVCMFSLWQRLVFILLSIYCVPSTTHISTTHITLPRALEVAAATAAKPLQSCPTLFDPIDGSPPGSPVPGILQARTLEWVAISFSNVWKWKVKVKSLSRFCLLANPWTEAYQAPPSMGFSRQEYWSGVSLPSPALEVTNLIFPLDRRGRWGSVNRTRSTTQAVTLQVTSFTPLYANMKGTGTRL